MFPLLLCCFLNADDDGERARALLALAAAQVQVAKPKSTVEKLHPPRLEPEPTAPKPSPPLEHLSWLPIASDLNQSALMRGAVQVGAWHHGWQLYRPCDPTGSVWGPAEQPPIAPPARSLRAAPALLLGPARQNC